MVRIGLVGVGFMGWIHYLAYQHLKGAKLAAVSSRDRAKLASTAMLAQRAAALEGADPAYRAELRAWTSDQWVDEVPGIDLGTGDLPSDSYSGIDQCLLVLWTAGDNPLAWLQAGEALQRALLELTRQGYAAGLMSQVAEVPSVRAALRRELDLPGEPHLLVRVGWAPMTPATRRRRLVEVLVEHL